MELNGQIHAPAAALWEQKTQPQQEVRLAPESVWILPTVEPRTILPEPSHYTHSPATLLQKGTYLSTVII